MPANFLEEIQKKILLIDGAMGTQLQAHGLPVGEASEKFNLDHAEIVQKIHQDYIDAGADIILTNTFGGNRFKLEANQLGDKVEEINRRAVEVACEAAGEAVFVAASIGPTGQFLAPLGSVESAQMIDMFAEQIEIVARYGVNIICIETMSDPEEAKCAVLAAKSVCQLPIIASMTYNQGKSGYRTLMGNDVAACVNILGDAGADVLSTNCGYGIDQITQIIQEMKLVTDIPFMAEPNAGLPELKNGKTVYNETAAMMAEKLPALLKTGVRIVGGCCGTTPDYIRAFRKVIDTYDMN